MAKKTRGRQAGGRNARSAAKHLLPRLALWAGVGLVILFPALVNCDSDEENNEPVEEGFVYVGTMPGTAEQIHKLKASTGEKVFTLGGENWGQLTLDVDRVTGDMFVYTPYYLTKYSKNGERQYVSYIEVAHYYDRMVYDGGTGDVWVFISEDGYMERYDGSNGEFISRFNIAMGFINQLIYDEAAGLFWIVAGQGFSVTKYTREGNQLLEIKDDGELTPMVIDRKTGTILIGFYSSVKRSNSVRRYDKTGSMIDEFPTTLSTGKRTQAIAVEPGTGRIWVSDSERTEIYGSSGQLLRVLPEKGFTAMDFDAAGNLMFGTTNRTDICAIRTSDLEEIWTTRKSGAHREFPVVKYSRQ